eukprot:scaffold145_cov261-Pinguiococcus_pyrenoidosus.AAC.12
MPTLQHLSLPDGSVFQVTASGLFALQHKEHKVQRGRCLLQRLSLLTQGSLHPQSRNCRGCIAGLRSGCRIAGIVGGGLISRDPFVVLRVRPALLVLLKFPSDSAEPVGPVLRIWTPDSLRGAYERPWVLDDARIFPREEGYHDGVVPIALTLRQLKPGGFSSPKVWLADLIEGKAFEVHVLCSLDVMTEVAFRGVKVRNRKERRRASTLIRNAFGKLQGGETTMIVPLHDVERRAVLAMVSSNLEDSRLCAILLECDRVQQVLIPDGPCGRVQAAFCTTRSEDDHVSL